MSMGDVIECAASFANDTKNSANEIAMLYQKGPFLASSTENIPIARKSRPVRRIIIDKTNFTNFVESAKDLAAVKNLFSCMGQDKVDINTEGLVKSIASFPSIYVEVDNQYQFTRLYFEYAGDEWSITIDLDLSYPNNLNIAEPKEYIDSAVLMGGSTASEETTDTEHDE